MQAGVGAIQAMVYAGGAEVCRQVWGLYRQWCMQVGLEYEGKCGGYTGNGVCRQLQWSIQA